MKKTEQILHNYIRKNFMTVMFKNDFKDLIKLINHHYKDYKREGKKWNKKAIDSVIKDFLSDKKSKKYNIGKIMSVKNPRKALPITEKEKECADEIYMWIMNDEPSYKRYKKIAELLISKYYNEKYLSLDITNSGIFSSLVRDTYNSFVRGKGYGKFTPKTIQAVNKELYESAKQDYPEYIKNPKQSKIQKIQHNLAMDRLKWLKKYPKTAKGIAEKKYRDESLAYHEKLRQAKNPIPAVFTIGTLNKAEIISVKNGKPVKFQINGSDSIKIYGSDDKKTIIITPVNTEKMI